MSREVLTGAIVVVIALAGLAVFGSGLTGMRTSTEVSNTGPLPEPPRDGSAGIVRGMRTTPHSTLGFRWGRASQTVTVQLVVRPECAYLLSDPNAVAESAGECPAILRNGRDAGGGINQFGDRIVALEIEVSRECFEAVSYGDRWPHESEQCRDGNTQ